MKRLVLILLIFPLLFSGCSSTVNQKQLDAVERGEMALIVSSCMASTPPVGLIIKDYDPEPCQTGWSITEGRGIIGRSDIEHPTEMMESSKFQQICIHAVLPGKYFLTYFTAYKSDSWAGYINTYTADNIHNIATFDAQGGDVLYIGDMDFNLRSSAIITKAISVHNNTDVAKKALEKRYPKFSDKLRTQLIQLSPYVAEVKNSDNVINTEFVKK